jgi:hypothetical protein
MEFKNAYGSESPVSIGYFIAFNLLNMVLGAAGMMGNKHNLFSLFSRYFPITFSPLPKMALFAIFVAIGIL